jgi:hypothetical protein
MAVHFADLVAFVKVPDLPPSLLPFLKLSDAKPSGDIRITVFKIRGTVDSYYSMPVRKGATVEAVAARMKKDLRVVRLAEESAGELSALLEKFKAGEFAHMLKHEIDKRHPYRH